MRARVTIGCLETGQSGLGARHGVPVRRLAVLALANPVHPPAGPRGTRQFTAGVCPYLMGATVREALSECGRAATALVFVKCRSSAGQYGVDPPVAESGSLRGRGNKGVPFSFPSEGWVSHAVAQFGFKTTMRNPWRPNKGT